jgi:hypothetical protein
MQAIIQRLLASATFEASLSARADIESRLVDDRLIATLFALTNAHCIAVSTVKTGHPMGPTTPGGFSNSHYYYRAVDIVAVDGKPIAGHATDPAILDVGRILRHLPPQERPDHIYGPAEWHAALGYSSRSGFRSDPFHDKIHADHLHLSFESETSTSNEE